MIVDRAISDWSQPCHSRRSRDAFHVLFCARMQTGSPHVHNLLLVCQLAHEMRTIPGTPKDMETATSLHVRSRQQYFVVACKSRAVRGLGSRARGVVRSFFVSEHRCLSCHALAVERHPLFIKVQFVGHASRNDVRVFIAAIGAFLSEVERSCAVLLRMLLFDCDVCEFVTSKETFHGWTGVMPTATTRGMGPCICHDLSVG